MIALDATWEMLRAAGEAGRQQFGDLVAADALSLPLRDQCLDAVFAAGILHHLPGPDHGLAELRRTTRPARGWPCSTPSGGPPSPPATAAPSRTTTSWPPPNLERVLRDHGWELTSIDDGDERYLAIAVRV